mmetsp:Transcript_34982/g.75542  ORF Transcript_34982/g.75542 Transcript_34982/m.75542 type:complete len:333 (+) Transcript_34982:1247-2245(+)
MGLCFLGPHHHCHLDALCNAENWNRQKHCERHLPTSQKCNHHANENGAKSIHFVTEVHNECRDPISMDLQSCDQFARTILWIVMVANLLTEHVGQHRYTGFPCRDLSDDSEASKLHGSCCTLGHAKHHKPHSSRLCTGLHHFLVRIHECNDSIYENVCTQNGEASSAHQCTQKSRDEETPISAGETQQAKHWDLVGFCDPCFSCILILCLLLRLFRLGNGRCDLPAGHVDLVLINFCVRDLAFHHCSLCSSKSLVNAALFGSQLLVRALLHDLSALKDIDHIRIFDCAQTMCDRYNCHAAQAAALSEVIDGLLDHLLRGAVQSAGGFVQEQD